MKNICNLVQQAVGQDTPAAQPMSEEVITVTNRSDSGEGSPPTGHYGRCRWRYVISVDEIAVTKAANLAQAVDYLNANTSLDCRDNATAVSFITTYLKSWGSLASDSGFDCCFDMG